MPQLPLCLLMSLVLSTAVARATEPTLSTIHASMLARDLDTPLATSRAILPRANTTEAENPYTGGKPNIPDKCKTACKPFAAVTTTCDITTERKCACKANVFDAYAKCADCWPDLLMGASSVEDVLKRTLADCKKSGFAVAGYSIDKSGGGATSTTSPKPKSSSESSTKTSSKTQGGKETPSDGAANKEKDKNKEKEGEGSGATSRFGGGKAFAALAGLAFVFLVF